MTASDSGSREEADMRNFIKMPGLEMGVSQGEPLVLASLQGAGADGCEWDGRITCRGGVWVSETGRVS